MPDLISELDDYQDNSFVVIAADTVDGGDLNMVAGVSDTVRWSGTPGAGPGAAS